MKTIIIRLLTVAVIALSNAGRIHAQVNLNLLTGNSSVTAKINYINISGNSLAYKVIGKGEPIIFIQRFRGTLSDWDPAFVDAVAKKYQVILFDLPGVGSSSGITPISLTEMGEDVYKFVNALGLNQAHFLGWSMGGMIAQIIAINHPDFIKKMILIGTSPSGNSETVYGTTEFSKIAGKPVYTIEDHQYLFFYSSETSGRACIESLNRIKKIKNKSPETRSDNWQNQYTAILSFYGNKEKNYFDLLKTIKAPVLIGNGKYDPAFPLINSYLLEREIKNAKLLIYPDAGHGFQHQYANDFTHEVINFLK